VQQCLINYVYIPPSKCSPSSLTEKYEILVAKINSNCQFCSLWLPLWWAPVKRKKGLIGLNFDKKKNYRILLGTVRKTSIEVNDLELNVQKTVICFDRIGLRRKCAVHLVLLLTGIPQLTLFVSTLVSRCKSNFLEEHKAYTVYTLILVLSNALIELRWEENAQFTKFSCWPLIRPYFCLNWSGDEHFTFSINPRFQWPVSLLINTYT